MKIKHWKQLKDFSQDDIVDLLDTSFYNYVNLVEDTGDWYIVEIETCFKNNEVKSEYSNCYIKDIEKPTLPFVFNL